MSHKNDKVQNVSMVSQILTSVKDSLLSRECYLHEHQRIVCLYLSPRIYWKWTGLHTYLMRFFCNHSNQQDLFYQHTLYKKVMSIDLTTMVTMTQLYQPFHYLISSSLDCLPYNSFDVCSENLVLNQLIIYTLIFFFILITCLFDIVLIW